MLDNEKKKQISILISIAMVDEDFPEEERKVIDKIAEKYGATPADMAELYKTQPEAENLAPMSETEKMNFIMDCMLVVLADEIVTVSERAFALQMASRLGFKDEVVPFLIAHKEVSREEMFDLLKPFMK